MNFHTFVKHLFRVYIKVNRYTLIILNEYLKAGSNVFSFSEEGGMSKLDRLFWRGYYHLQQTLAPLTVIIGIKTKVVGDVF